MNEQLKKIFGLVLTGGKSSRMQKDKSRLVYHNRPQAQVGYDLLKGFCPQVFLSDRSEYPPGHGWKDLPVIYDDTVYEDIGPLAGILSAMNQYPDNPWLVLACDLPFVSVAAVSHLIKHRNPRKMATAYRSRHDQLPEPLCAVYEPRFREILQASFEKDIYCPRKIMISADVERLDLQEAAALDNINTPEEYDAALKKIRGERDA